MRPTEILIHEHELIGRALDVLSLFARRIGAWKGNPKDEALSLRAAGGLHAVARSGRCPALSSVYPPHAADADAVWEGIAAAIIQEDNFLTAYLDGPPQTNEVARSNAILGGCLFIAGKTERPLELFEIGSSAGLNLSFDCYGYDLGLGRWGSVDAPVRIAVHERQCIRSMPGDADDRHQCVRQDAAQSGVGLEVFESQTAAPDAILVLSAGRVP